MGLRVYFFVFLIVNFLAQPLFAARKCNYLLNKLLTVVCLAAPACALPPPQRYQISFSDLDFENDAPTPIEMQKIKKALLIVEESLGYNDKSVHAVRLALESKRLLVVDESRLNGALAVSFVEEKSTVVLSRQRLAAISSDSDLDSGHDLWIDQEFFWHLVSDLLHEGTHIGYDVRDPEAPRRTSKLLSRLIKIIKDNSHLKHKDEAQKNEIVHHLLLVRQNEVHRTMTYAANGFETGLEVINKTYLKYQMKEKQNPLEWELQRASLGRHWSVFIAGEGSDWIEVSGKKYKQYIYNYDIVPSVP
ncbi:MAG: hypothetical protein AB7F43_10680 [Bacteriovoracia bacterium]